MSTLRNRAQFAVLALSLSLSACGESPSPKPEEETTPFPIKIDSPQDTSHLIPREDLFGNPTRTIGRISPDGSRISFLAPVDGVLNIWVGPADDIEKAEPVTHDTNRGINYYMWSADGSHLVFSQDKMGDDNYHVYAVEIASRVTRDLTPIVDTKIKAKLGAEINWDIPDEIMVRINDRDQLRPDLYKISISTGERQLVMENEGSDLNVIEYVVDNAHKPRMAVVVDDIGKATVHRITEQGEWPVVTEMDSADLLLARIYGFDKANEHFYLTSSDGRNTSALYAVNIETGERTIIGANEKADIAWVLKNPLEKNIEAFSINYDREEWATTDPEIAEALAFVAQAANGDFTVVNKTRDNRLWMVHYNVDDAPGTYYLIDIVDKTARKVFSQWPKLEGAPLAKMHARIIRARDGLDLVSYLTLPLDSDPDLDGKPDAPVPLVLNVHGGPWKRDQFGFNATHQWLANRGYAVLSVNYRGSHGFGKTFIEAASREFAGKMHDDLIDAVDWAIATDITTPDQVAIMGGSYGGYASLVGLTFTPDRFACGIDIAGPSNLVSFIENMPDMWQIERDTLWYPLVGDPRTEEGRALLESRSPLFKVDEITKPLLIMQGAKDEIVSPSEAVQIVEASKARGLPVTYALYPDEGHDLMHPETKKSSRALIEGFLAKCLGGEFEPFGTTLDEVNLEIVEGAEHIPGLEQAILAKAEKRSTQQ